MEIIHTLISFVSVAAIMGCFFFLNDTKNIWYSLSFLLLFGLTQIIENLCVYYQINYFDETYIPLYFKNKNNQTKNKYYELLDFKRNFFVSKRTLISSILLAISIAFVLCFNDFRNILIILILVLLKCLEMLLLSKRNKNTENLVGELEAKGLDFSKDNSGKLLLANRCSNQKVLKDSIRNLLFMGLSFLLALLMMVITNNSGCNFVIFYFVVYYAEIRAWSDVLELISKKQNKLKYECKFFDNCNL